MNESFKKTEAGVIPVDWSCRTIGEIAYVGRGRVISHREISRALSPNYPVYSSQTSNNGVMGYLDTYDFDGKYVTWTTDGVNAGTVFYRSGKFNCTNVCGTIKPIEQNTSYVALVLSQRTNRYVSRNLANPKLMNDVMKQIAIALPSNVNEQHEIATAITEADELISSLDQLIAKKRDIQQAAMQQLLTGQRRLPGFSGEWEVKRFGEVVACRSERVDPRLAERQDFCVELEHIEPRSGRLIGHTSADESSSLKAVFKCQDVLFGKLRAYQRKYWLAGREGVCSTEIWALSCDTRFLLPDFLYHLVKTDAFIEAASTAYGTHMPRSDWKVVKQFDISLPMREEQTAIATILSDMDTELAALETRRDKARQLKQGMMQELLTGRIRLIDKETV